ncbi:Glycosyl transferase family 2 [Quadrisphaera granulorum]|uniref:Glycosyl transferase family 2 n=1 Tax=Quadrisphaera granulorum TaxID=317664 RepID=A0A316ACJ6_9ACTN|nr:glycosyltransferase family 2 protein [Quadrisphaera granulorum]PWJ55129.1 glycosyl transferase family 2 [Quadrisphaera granulorum]SZE95638.1 Glycosyl transferase family 2 [Quadrisphaera granulorum]
MHRLSVVIANYNYARFLSAAIDSALAIDWPDVEVVVVDDGSTDDSVEVIKGYGSTVTAIFTENGGQRAACNHGFAASSGDVVVFLDADDVLPPAVARRVDAVMTPRTSKVQLQMQRITEDGQPVGEPFPDFAPPPTPAQVRHWATTTTAYPTPPGSGNAYARWFLERIFPVGPEVGAAADSACLAAAPLLGDVVSLPGVLVGYRQHSAQDSSLLGDLSRFAREVGRARARWRFALAASGAALDDTPLFRSRELLQFRAAASRVASAPSPLPGDGTSRRVLDAFRSPTWPGPEPVKVRLLIAGWTLAVLLAPSTAVPRLLRLRYSR